MSQVKNLRAMFESKGDTSPPDRGRSSGASTPVPVLASSDSPRPLSKVRTSFVAVEKDGRIGLRRDQSHESSASRRRLSMETDPESTSTVPDKLSVAADDVPKVSKLVLHETIPESPRQPSEVEKKLEITSHDAPAVSEKPISPPEKPDPVKLDTPEPVEIAPKSPMKEPKASAPSTSVNGKAKSEKPKEPTSSTPSKIAIIKKPTARPAPISTTKPTSKPVVKSPLKTPTNASDKGASKQTAKAHDKPVAKKEPTPAKAAPSSAIRQTASGATKKPQPLKPSASETGFIKPKVKSPTKPVNLPSSLTAPTASSVSKGASARHAMRPSSSTGNLNIPPRSSSRASISTTTSTGRKPQTSTTNRSRPSLGPPPKKGTSEGPHRKEAVPVDEGFLARMMRPTQSSSSKTTEKTPVTPPRKTVKRPSLGAEARREHRIRAPGSGKKPLRRQAEPPTLSHPAHSKESSPAPADESVVISEPEVVSERTTTEPTEEAAKPIQEAEPSAAPELKEDKIESTPAKEVAEQPETLSEVVESVQEETVEPEVADETEEVTEEPVVESTKEEPVLIEQPNVKVVEVEVVESEPFNEPEAETEDVAENETGKTVKAAEEAKKTEDTPVAEGKALPIEEATTESPEVVTPVPETKEPAEERPIKTEDNTKEVIPSSEAGLKEEKEGTEENPEEGEKKHSETISREDLAT